jgi:dUTP pyrophosphatase
MDQNSVVDALLSFRGRIFSYPNCGTFMELTIFVDSDDAILKNKYVEAAENHNRKIMSDPVYYDAGFDLFLPKVDSMLVNERFFFEIPHTNKVDFQVKCCANIHSVRDLNHYSSYPSYPSYPTPFYTYARSSISKTPLRLANNQGIIDAGYRGSLIGMFDSFAKFSIEPYSRLLQICAPSLMPIFVRVVDSVEELGPSTPRGEGGFGSTGK